MNPTRVVQRVFLVIQEKPLLMVFHVKLVLRHRFQLLQEHQNVFHVVVVTKQILLIPNANHVHQEVIQISMEDANSVQADMFPQVMQHAIVFHVQQVMSLLKIEPNVSHVQQEPTHPMEQIVNNVNQVMSVLIQEHQNVNHVH
jgi:hypothetical protein